MQLFSAVRIFNPSYAGSRPLSSVDVDALAVFAPIVHHVSLDALKAELPAYVARVTDVVIAEVDVNEFSTQVLAWWRANASFLPRWSSAARLVFALAPNSASCERVFSLLECMFGDAQMRCYGDYLQSALMLRYNNRA